MYRYHPYERPRFSCFGAQPAFGGTSTPAFGGTSTPAFGSNSSPFGGSFSDFRSQPFGATSQSGIASTGFGAASTPACGNSSAPSYGFDRFASILAFGQSASALGVASTPVFGNNPSSGSTPSLFGAQRSAFGSFSDFRQTQLAFRSQPFGATSQSAVASTGFGTASTPACGNSSAPSYGFTRFASIPAFGQSASALGAASTPVFGNNPSSGSTPSLFGAQRSAFGPFSDFHQTQPAFHSQPFGATSQSAVASTGFGAASTLACGQTTFGQPAEQNMMVMVPLPVSNPFGTLPPMPQMCIGRSAGSAPSIQYGISSLPVIKKPTKVRTTSLLAPRHITPKSRICMHSRGYKPKRNGSMVSFFSDGEEALSTARADAMLFLPRENPRALFIRQPDQSSPSVVLKPAVNMKEMAVPINDHEAKENRPGGLEDANIQNNLPSSKLVDGLVKSSSGQNGSSEDIEALMPKLRNFDYYTEPAIQELAAKERAQPGYCSRVKDFVLGRKGYGYVKFFGETDVRQLDLDSIIQFKKCEFLPVFKRLDKLAEITLLNVQCVDEKTGQHCTEGVEVDKLEERLKRKNEQEGAEFMSYDAIKGEWKFCVNDFSKKNCRGGLEDANIQNNSLSSKLVDDLVKSSSRQNGSSEEHSHGEVAIVYEHGEDIEALMPKLQNSDYYTEPTIQELAAKERAEPGYCSRVKDFVLGRKGYGYVTFFGEIDVTQLDLDNIIQFKECELSVYNRKNKKPFPDKPAEITLLNVQCVDKKTGQHCTEGMKVDRLEKRLKRKTEQEGAEFMSYNAIKGEWKFRVKCFSKKIRRTC